jgi:predicted NUDIX family phosphoesterase
MASRADEELVLVFESWLLDELGRFQGLCRDVEPFLESVFENGNCQFIPRTRAETDPGFKQLIPYVILRHGPDVFHYVRGKESGEGRLHAKGSIGIGGHIQPGDVTLFSTGRNFYMSAAAREVSEEVRVETEHRERIVALLNDDSNPVGQVHFGIVHMWWLESPAVQKRERQITRCGFLPPEELRTRRDTLEGWSQLCLEILDQS